MAARHDAQPDLAKLIRAAAQGGDYHARLVRLEVEAAEREKSHNQHVVATEGVLREMRGDIKVVAEAQVVFSKQFAAFAAKSDTLFGFGGKLGQGMFGVACALLGAAISKAMIG